MKSNITILRNKVLLVLMLFGCVNFAFGQFAGPDYSKVITPGDTLRLNIGKIDNTIDACYTWTQMEGIVDYENNKHDAVIELKLTTEGTYVYTVERVSIYGVEEDVVVVTVKECPEITRFRPKIDCLNDGDEVKKEDFIIETDPPEYKSHVTLTPLTVSNWTASDIKTEDIVAELTCPNDGSVYRDTCQIDVRREPSLDVSLSGDVLALINALNELSKLNTQSEKIENFIEKFNHLFGEASPCQPSGSLSLDIDMNFVRSVEICCEGEEKVALKITLPYASTSIGINCIFPFAGCPKAASINFNGALSIGLTWGPISIMVSEEENNCTTNKLPLTFFANGRFAVIGMIGPSPDIVSVSGGIDISMKLPLECGIGEKVDWGDVTINFDASLEFIMMGGKAKFTYHIGKIKL